MAEPRASAVALRRGVPADAAAVRGLGEVVVPATYGPIDPAYADLVLDRWWAPTHLEDSLGRIRWWVAESGDRLAGIACLGPLDQREVMWMLYVHPDHQGDGLGGRLLDAVVDAVDGDALWLEHVAGNDAAAGFYRARGFVETERVPQPPYPDQVWMRRDL